MTFVTEFLISLRGIPRPSLAAIKASGYPVALEARADERDKRALTCIKQIYSALVQITTNRTRTSMMQYS